MSHFLKHPVETESSGHNEDEAVSGGSTKAALPTYFDDSERVLAQAGEPPELRHAGHRLGENLQHGDGASEGDPSPVLLTQLGVFSQERQGVLDGEANVIEFQCLALSEGTQ